MKYLITKNACPKKCFQKKMFCNSSHLGLEPCSHVLPDLLLEANSHLLSTIHNHHGVWRKQKRRCETPVGVVWCSCWYVICVLCVICVTLIAFVVFFVVPESLAKVLAFCFWIFPTFLKALKRFPKLFSEIRVFGRRPICWTSKEKGHHLHDHQDQTRWTSKVPQFQNVLPRKLEEISTKCLEMA